MSMIVNYFYEMISRKKIFKHNTNLQQLANALTTANF